MLRPAHGITDGGSLVGARSGSERFGSFQEYVLRHTAIALNHLGRVALEVALQHLENAARMLQGRIRFVLPRVLGFAATIFAVSSTDLGMSRSLAAVLLGSALIQPAFWVVLLFLCIPTGEESVEVLGIAEVFAKNRGRIGVAHDVIAERSIVLEHVVHESA